MKNIQQIIKTLNKGIIEKNEVIAVSFLAAISGQNIFLLGPSGTAKSLISRRLASVFETQGYFEYLMQRFSTPEEVFGPVSLAELKKDNYVRKTKGYLPEADFAFLDEIWKSSPAVLNTLLTVINEKKYKNGDTILNVPLKSLISASNEVPSEGQGLDALYDRFLVRLFVPPTKLHENFEALLQTEPAPDQAEVTEKITPQDLETWSQGIKNVQLSKETLAVIRSLRLQIEQHNEQHKEPLYISDRRWQKAAHFLKAGAFFCERDTTNLVDTLLLKHCLWSNEKDLGVIVKLIEQEVASNGVTSTKDIVSLEEQKVGLEQEIESELFHSQDIYKIISVNDEECYVCKVTLVDDRYLHNHSYNKEIKPKFEDLEFLVPVSHKSTLDKHHPSDLNGNRLEKFFYNFKGQSSFTISERRNQKAILKTSPENPELTSSLQMNPPIEIQKGDIKKNLNPRLFASMTSEINKLSLEFKEVLEEVNRQQKMLTEQLYSPFVPEKDRKLALRSVDSQITRISNILSDCELALEKIQKARAYQ